MRSNLHVIGLGFLVVLAAGCESTRWNWLKRDSAQDTPGKGGAPSAAALVTYLNDNAGRIRSLRVDDMSVDVTMENQTFGLQGGRLFAEKPRNFRMKATALGKDEADIGSNAQEFWFWVARNPQPFQYFCSYRDLNEGRVIRMPLPIQPEWVMETMGLGPYGPPERYQLEQDKKVFRLIEKAKSPTGQPVRKVIVLNREPVRSPEPQVIEYLLLDDATGKEICAAHISRTQIDKATGAILPYRMVLRMPDQKVKMDLKLDRMTLNAPIDNPIFQRQQVAGVQPFNLATGQAEPFQRAQGIGLNPNPNPPR